jgi:hypothetical protein
MGKEKGNVNKKEIEGEFEGEIKYNKIYIEYKWKS